MNARDLNIPLYEPPQGDFYQNINEPSNIIDLSNNWGGTWQNSNGDSGFYDKNGNYYNGRHWKKIKPEDLPEFETKKAQNLSMMFNAMEAQKARNWQERMYGSRFQKTMEDIKKAGLNPYILNMFSPGGFGTGGAASIYTNIAKQYAESKSRSEISSKSKNENLNKRQETPLEWVGVLLPLLGAVVGSFFSGAGGAIGGGLGHLAARAIMKKNRK